MQNIDTKEVDLCLINTYP